MKPINPCLWFNKDAEEAVKFYTSIFPNSKILKTTYYQVDGHMPKGSVLTISFELNGTLFVALNTNESSEYTHALSLMAPCETQQEIDELWDKILKNGGQEVECGWIKDKYGVSWQVFPTVLLDMIADQNPEKAKAAMNAMMKMVKIDLPTVEKAYKAAA